MPISIRFLPALALAASLVACSDDETGPEESHTPARAAVFVDGADVSDNLLLPVGEAVRVEVRFYNDEDEEITGIDDDHFASLTFTPDDFAAVAAVTGENFQKDVTGGEAIGVATFQVGYGHDEDADELEFGPFDATVVATGDVRAQGR